MNRTGQLAIAYSLGRVAYGVGLTAVTGKVGESWLGAALILAAGDR